MFGLNKYQYSVNKTYLVYAFQSHGPKGIIQKIANRNWESISPIFDVWGLRGSEWKSFEKGVNYQAFLGRRKGAFLFS